MGVDLNGVALNGWWWGWLFKDVALNKGSPEAGFRDVALNGGVSDVLFQGSSLE